MSSANENAAELNGAQTSGRAVRTRFKELLKNNQLGIVDNPILYIPDLDRSIRRLYEKKHLEDVLDVGLLIRGARLAKDEDPLDPAVDLDSLEDLSEMEKRAIERQRNVPFWRMPKDLLVVMLTCCLGALTQGWDQQGIAGANLGWPGEFGLDINLDNANNNDIWIFGAVNAITYFSASVVGAYISDPLNEYLFGRRGALFTAGLFSFSSVIGSAYSTTWRELFATRFLLGIGIGAKASIVPIFESEVLPPSRRGRLLISWQVFTATGIFFGAAANIVLRDHWRWQAASGFIPAFPLFFLAFVCTESPRWLIKQRNRYDKAYESLLRLRKIPILAARELCFIHYQIQVERSLFYDRRVPDAEQDDDNGNESGDPFDAQYASSSYPRRFLNLFHYSRNRRASLAAFVVMISQQLSGVNIFAFLAATFFNTANTGESGSLWLSFAFGLSNAVFSVLAYWLIDTKGRRFLLVFSLFGMIWTMLATGLSFNISPDNSARLGVITFWLILYTFFYSPGAGVVPFLYSSEVFPNENREVGMSWAVSWNFLGAGILTLLVPLAIERLNHTRLLGLFSGLNAVALILVWLFVPSTTEVAALEDMSYVFGVPTKRHVEYQIKEHLPWQYKRLKNQVPFLPKEHLDPLDSLYTWHRSREEGAAQPEEEEEEDTNSNAQDDRRQEDDTLEIEVVNYQGKEKGDLDHGNCKNGQWSNNGSGRQRNVQDAENKGMEEQDEGPYGEPGIPLARLN